VDTVVKVHGHQILKMGVFNGDPHPVSQGGREGRREGGREGGAAKS
jgi:hypothetical protein